METESAVALITWLTLAQGGRVRPRSGRTIATPAIFEDDINNQAWTVIIDNIESVDPPLVIKGSVRFIVDGAPHHLLKVGNRFGLYEGSKLVAHAQIVG